MHGTTIRLETRSRVLAPLLALALAACGGGGGSVSEAGGEPELRSGIEALTADNGLSVNGLSVNGLSVNGLSVNGLSVNGLNAGAFVAWFNTNASTNGTVMSYVYRCAAPASKSISWTNPSTGVKYTWSGVLGLAPGWANGSAATLAEQQLVSACLAAHVNLNAVHVSISVSGVDGTGAVIPVSASEASSYSIPEACWFGNLFNGDGVGFAFDTGTAGFSQSSTRGCAFPSPSGTASCSPIVNSAKYCWDLCTRDASGTFWRSCRWNGKTYAPLTTRYRPQEIATCGDGVCQATERCGTGYTPQSCADCGPCK